MSFKNLNQKENHDHKKGRPLLELDRTAIIYFVKSGATKKHIQDYLGIAKSTLYRYLKKAPITEDELSQVEIAFLKKDIEKDKIELVEKPKKKTISEPVKDKADSKIGLANLIADLENADDF